MSLYQVNPEGKYLIFLIFAILDSTEFYRILTTVGIKSHSAEVVPAPAKSEFTQRGIIAGFSQDRKGQVDIYLIIIMALNILGPIS